MIKSCPCEKKIKAPKTSLNKNVCHFSPPASKFFTSFSPHSYLLMFSLLLTHGIT